MQIIPYLIAGGALAMSAIGGLLLLLGLYGTVFLPDDPGGHFTNAFLWTGGVLIAVSAPIGWWIYRLAERTEDDRSGSNR